jgi:septal ring factor EnvC (AmiA/AmiB activator)
MWPRVLMQLVELLPHVSRLVPVADRYFSSKASGERASEIASLAEGVQTDLGQVTKAYAGLYRQLQEQGTQISAVGDEVHQVRASLEASDRRVVALEQRVNSLNLWIRGGVIVMTVLLIVVIGLLLRK